MKIFLQLFSVFLFIEVAVAGGRDVGNGGDAVVCLDKNQIKSAVFYDLWEAEHLRGWKAQLGSPELDVALKVNLALQALAKISPLKSSLYAKWAKEFFQEAKMIPLVKLKDIRDSDHTVEPNDPNCKLHQAVIQIAPTNEEDSRYYISNEIWTKLDNDNRAALILHEIIYREAIAGGAENSVSSRYLTTLMTSGHILTKPAPEIVKSFVKNKTKYLDLGGVQYELDNSTLGGIIFYPNNVVTTGYVVANSDFAFNGHNVKINKVYFFPTGHIDWITFSSPEAFGIDGQKLSAWELFFYADGKLRSLVPAENVSLSTRFSSIRTSTGKYGDGNQTLKTEFSNDGNLLQAWIVSGKFILGAGTVIVETDSPQFVEFHRNGRVKGFYSREPLKLQRRDKSFIVTPPKSYIAVDEDGFKI